MAYDAGVAAGLRSCIIDLYVASIFMLDPAWFVEKAGISRQEQFEAQDKAITEIFPKLEELLDELDVEGCLIAPIVFDTAWDGLVASLPSYDSRGSEGQGSQSPRYLSNL